LLRKEQNNGKLGLNFDGKQLHFQSVLTSDDVRMNDFHKTQQATTLHAEAEAFITCMAEDGKAHQALARLGGIEVRLRAISDEIDETGTYTHTTDELQFGARLAWRNSNRCIGRHLWRTLEVRDARNAHDSENPEKAITETLKGHLADAFNGGRIKSIISVFSPRRTDGSDAVRIANHQLTRYAGFRMTDGNILGDPHSVELTDQCLAHGWKPQERTRFTPLPWQFNIEGKQTKIQDVFHHEPALFREVPLIHPEIADFDALGLRWYAVPLLSDMAMKIGGSVYPFAPFNGFYMGTEIGARNLADQSRYDVLPDVADLLGLDVASNRSLWRDRSMVELNRAVLHSFDRAGITIGDHHALGEQFEAFCQAESRKGREVKGDWSWLSPPMSASQTPQFHRSFNNEVVQHTNFFYQQPQVQQTKPSKKTGGCPFHL
jgi:nitric-oxide synthase